MVSKALVRGAYQRKLEELARFPDVDLTLVTPPARTDSGHRVELERAFTSGYRLEVLPIRFDGSELMVCTTEHYLVRALRFAGWRIRAQCYFVMAEPRALGEALTRYYPMAGMSPDVIVGKNTAG